MSDPFGYRIVGFPRGGSFVSGHFWIHDPLTKQINRKMPDRGNNSKYFDYCDSYYFCWLHLKFDDRVKHSIAAIAHKF